MPTRPRRIDLRSLAPALLAAALALAVTAAVSWGAPPDGPLDTAFGVAGVRSQDLGSPGSQAAAVAKAADGSYWVAGRDAAANQLVLAHYTAAGALDTTFNGVGYKSVMNASQWGPQLVAVQPDGKIVVGAEWSGLLVLARVHPDGSLDTNADADPAASCGPTGIKPWFDATNSRGHSVLLSRDGTRIYVAGSYGTGASADTMVAAYRTSDCAPDPGWGGGDGIATFTFDAGNFDTGDGGMVEQPNGFVVVAGHANDFTFGRFDTSGVADPLFGGSANGMVSVDVAGNADGAHALVRRPGGALLAVGQASEGCWSCYWGIAAVQVTAAGAPDASFGGGDGKVVFHTGPSDGTTDDAALAATLLADGSTMIAGRAKNVAGGSDDDALVARITAAGTLDATFSGDGIDQRDTAPGASDVLDAMVPAGDGGVVSVGNGHVGSDDTFLLLKHRVGPDPAPPAASAPNFTSTAPPATPLFHGAEPSAAAAGLNVRRLVKRKLRTNRVRFPGLRCRRLSPGTYRCTGNIVTRTLFFRGTMRTVYRWNGRTNAWTGWFVGTRIRIGCAAGCTRRDRWRM